jgi:hypothetical protein
MLEFFGYDYYVCAINVCSLDINLIYVKILYSNSLYCQQKLLNNHCDIIVVNLSTFTPDVWKYLPEISPESI